MLWETWSFRVDEDRIGCGLNLLCQQIKADEQQEKLRQKNNLKKLPGPLPVQVANKMKREEKQEEKDEKVNIEEKVEKQVIKQEGKDETDNIKENKEVDKQTEKKHEGETDTDNKEQGKEIEKENVVGTEPLHQQEGKTSKTHEQKQEGDQENKTVKEGEHPTSQHDHPVSSCKLHSLGIVQLMKESDTGNTSASPKSSNKGDESSNVDPSLLIGVSYCRSSGAQEAAIIVCDIHTYKSVATSIKKNKAKSTALSSAGIGIEPMSDPLMDIDDVMPSALPITVDIDTPSWELVPPLPPEPPLVSSAIPPPPPLPPLKNGNASKTEKGSQLQIFVVSEYIDDLPVDAHPVVSVIQPCGYSRVAVALEYGPSYGGCIILFNLEQCTGKTILGKSIIYEFVESSQQVLDMCVMENLETRRNGNSHFLAAVTRSGSFVVFSMEMNVVVSMSVNSDPFVSCFPCVNVGLFGLVTRSGVVKTVKVVSGKPVPEVSVLAADVANSDTAGDSTISTSMHKG